MRATPSRGGRESSTAYKYIETVGIVLRDASVLQPTSPSASILGPSLTQAHAPPSPALPALSPLPRHALADLMSSQGPGPMDHPLVPMLARPPSNPRNPVTISPVAAYIRGSDADGSSTNSSPRASSTLSPSSSSTSPTRLGQRRRQASDTVTSPLARPGRSTNSPVTTASGSNNNNNPTAANVTPLTFRQSKSAKATSEPFHGLQLGEKLPDPLHDLHSSAPLYPMSSLTPSLPTSATASPAGPAMMSSAAVGTMPGATTLVPSFPSPSPPLPVKSTVLSASWQPEPPPGVLGMEVGGGVSISPPQHPDTRLRSNSNTHPPPVDPCLTPTPPPSPPANTTPIILPSLAIPSGPTAAIVQDQTVVSPRSASADASSPRHDVSLVPTWKSSPPETRARSAMLPPSPTGRRLSPHPPCVAKPTNLSPISYTRPTVPPKKSSAFSSSFSSSSTALSPPSGAGGHSPPSRPSSPQASPPRADPQPQSDPQPQPDPQPSPPRRRPKPQLHVTIDNPASSPPLGPAATPPEPSPVDLKLDDTRPPSPSSSSSLALPLSGGHPGGHHNHNHNPTSPLPNGALYSSSSPAPLSSSPSRLPASPVAAVVPEERHWRLAESPVVVESPREWRPAIVPRLRYPTGPSASSLSSSMMSASGRLVAPTPASSSRSVPARFPVDHHHRSDGPPTVYASSVTHQRMPSSKVHRHHRRRLGPPNPRKSSSGSRRSGRSRSRSHSRRMGSLGVSSAYGGDIPLSGLRLAEHGRPIGIRKRHSLSPAASRASPSAQPSSPMFKSYARTLVRCSCHGARSIECSLPGRMADELKLAWGEDVQSITLGDRGFALLYADMRVYASSSGIGPTDGPAASASSLSPSCLPPHLHQILHARGSLLDSKCRVPPAGAGAGHAVDTGAGGGGAGGGDTSPVNPRVQQLVLGSEERFFVLFADGTYEASGSNSFLRALKSMNVADDVSLVAFGMEWDSWVIVTSGNRTRFSRVSDSLKDRLTGVDGPLPPIQRLSIGPDAWFMAFKNGAWVSALPPAPTRAIEYVQAYRNGSVSDVVFGGWGTFAVRYTEACP